MEDISIVNELKELAGLQTEYAKTKMAIKFREVKNNAINKVSSIKSYIDEQAKIYGENNENIVSIKEEYSNQIEEITNNYEIGMTSLEESRQKIECLEMKAMGRMAELNKKIADDKKTEQYKAWKKTYDIYVKEAKEIGKTGNVNAYYEKMNEVRRMEKENPIYSKLVEQNRGKEYLKKASELLQENDEKQNNLENEAKLKIKEAMEEKTTALSEVKKQNFIQKFIGSLINKINGTKKFAKNVMNPMQKNLSKLKNELVPAFINKIKEEVGEKIQDAKELKGNVENKIVNVINKGRDMKDNVIKGVAGKIQGVNEKTQDKIKKLEANEQTL